MSDDCMIDDTLQEKREVNHMTGNAGIQILAALVFADSSLSFDEIRVHLSKNIAGLDVSQIYAVIEQLVLDGKVRFLKRDNRYKITSAGKNDILPVLEANYVYRMINPTTCRKELKLLTSGYREAAISTGDKREAVIFPDTDSESILNDLSLKGSDRFKAIANASSIDLDARVTIIRANSMEDGLKACLYLSLKQKDEDPEDRWDSFSFPKVTKDFNLSDMGAEVFSNLIPIVRSSSLHYYRSDMQELPFGGTLGSGIVNSMPPWWDAYTGDIILYCNYNCFGMELVDAISLFTKCSHVYAIVPEGSGYVPEGAIENEEDETENETVSPYIFKAVLRYEAAHYVIPAVNNIAYYSQVVQGLAKQYKLEISEDFAYSDFITALLELEHELPAVRMEELIKYHAKRSNQKLLDNSVLAMIKRIDAATTNTKELSGWDRLNAMAGLEDIKKQVKLLVNSFKAARKRRLTGLPAIAPCCIAMLGNPGTAKSTIAEIISEIMFKERLLPSKRLTTVTGAGLQGPYVGSTAYRVQELFDSSDVILIDEFYSIEGKGTYAQEALGELCVQIEKAQAESNKIVILAGYGGKDSNPENNLMLRAINSNPGISSRIGMVMNFPDYSPKECSEIYLSIITSKGYTLGNDTPVDKVREALTAFFEERVKDASFGNGREARALFQETVRISSERVFSSAEDENLITGEELSSLCISDVLNAIASMRSMNAAKAGRAPKCISLI